MRRVGLLCLPTLIVALLFIPLTRGLLQAEGDSATRPAPLVDARTRAAIAEGTRFLMSLQQSDGSWLSDAGKKINSTYKLFPEGKGIPHVGVTGLAVLSLLAGGHLPGRGPYGAAMDRAVRFLTVNMDEHGYIASGKAGSRTRMYSHAFATLALAEVYGVSQQPRLRQKVQDAIEFTVKCQNQNGGWRYVPFTNDSDMSVTVCQIVALRAARNVGIKVPQATIDRALGYILRSAISSEDGSGPAGAYWYQPHDQRFNRDSFALCAAGLTALFQAGLYEDAQVRAYRDSHDDGRQTPPPPIARSVRYMQEQYHEEYARNPDHYFYYYGNYYAAQAMYQLAGHEQGKAMWRRWYTTVRNHLLQRARSAKDGDGKRIRYWQSNVDSTHAYATACALLVLQFPLDHLPIHQR